MAHSPTTRTLVREAYAAGAALVIACERHKVPEATARAWKQRDAGTDLDWDKLRAAHALANGGHVEVVQRILTDFLEAHAEAIRQVKEAEIAPADRVELLSRLTDALSKTMAALSRAAPKLSELGVAMEILTLLAEFVRTRHPKSAPAILDILEPFGAELVKKYG
ncbi:hypothetical protein SIID45300_01755 [Candidatus Magnetaquicoccaceae bacterium FCR-1]|uniref:DNA-binding protein n=1 Tax=Candidatus Magnetaquiglobus chichijimensis TaxID=3141448 RepID=A0ABQ0C964_9PROT